MDQRTQDPLDLPTPPGGSRELYQSLVDTFDTYLRRVHQLIERDQPSGLAGTWVPYALFIHILQLGRALLLLVQAGYSEEALPIGRAMISAAMNLLFIVTSDNPDGWALRYWLQLADHERKYLARELRLERFDQKKIQQLITAADANLAGLHEALRREGITLPDKLSSPGQAKPRHDTWTGLSDRALAERLQLTDWYEGEYDHLSRVTHVQAISVKPIGDELLAGRLPSVGPHFREPLAAIAVAVSAIKFGFLGFMKHFNLVDRDPVFQAANNAMTSAINSYRDQSGANAIVDRVFGRRTGTTQ